MKLIQEFAALHGALDLKNLLTDCNAITCEGQSTFIYVLNCSYFHVMQQTNYLPNNHHNKGLIKVIYLTILLNKYLHLTV